MTDNDLSITGPGGISLRAHGFMGLVVLILIVIALGMGYLQWRTERAVDSLGIITRTGLGELAQSFTRADAAETAAMKQRADEHRDLERQQDVLACIISLTAEERTVLRRSYEPSIFHRFCPWVK